MAELRTVLAVLLGKFFFELPEGTQRDKFLAEEQVLLVSLQAKHGIALRVSSIMGLEDKTINADAEE